MLPGYICLHRKALDSRVFSDADLWRHWTWLLLRANYADGWFERQLIPRGSLATGTRSAAESLGLSSTTIHRHWKLLESWGMITRKVERGFSVISICNYGTYNDRPEGSGTQKERKRNAGGTLAEHERNAGGTLAEPIEEEQQEQQGKKNSPLPPKGEAAEPGPMDPPGLEEFPKAIRDEECRTAWIWWLAYKRKIRQPYKTARGQRDQLAAAAGSGRAAYLGCLRNAQRNEWKGPNLPAYHEMLAKRVITADGEPARPQAAQNARLFRDPDDPRGVLAAANAYLETPE